MSTVMHELDGSKISHWVGLHDAIRAEATDVVTMVTTGLLPHPLLHLDRYNHPLDHYGVEVEPLLSALIGAHLPTIHDLATFDVALTHMADAIALTKLALVPLRRQLPTYAVDRLDKGVHKAVDRFRALYRQARPGSQSDRHKAVVVMLARLGRLHHAEVLAGVHDGAIEPTQAMSVAAAWRYLHGYQRALRITECVIEQHPHHISAMNTKAAILTDTGQLREAHTTVLQVWAIHPNPYTARTLLRTAKNVGDHEAFGSAQLFLAAHQENRR